MDRPIKIIGGKVLVPEGIREASVIIREGRIAEITSMATEVPDAIEINAEGMYVAPGGIDIHVHGGGGYEFAEATEEAFRKAIKAHSWYGTTSILPTLPACPVDTIWRAVMVSEKIMSEPDSPMLGLHLEGPYLNPKKLGGIIPEYVTLPIKKDYEELLGGSDVIKRWDASPELPGVLNFGKCLMNHGVLGSIAHTIAEYTDVRNAFEAGFTHATHFYNAMSCVHKVNEYKREGTVESIYLIPEMTVEVIADGKHVPPAILRLIWMIKGSERTAIVTDALGCSCGGAQRMYDPRVIVDDGVCKLSDHSALAGSIATMDRLVKTMVMSGIPFYDAIKMSSETPARIIGADKFKGSLQKGKDADVVFYDENVDLKFVMQKGRIIRNDLN